MSPTNNIRGRKYENLFQVSRRLTLDSKERLASNGSDDGFGDETNAFWSSYWAKHPATRERPAEWEHHNVGAQIKSIYDDLRTLKRDLAISYGYPNQIEDESQAFWKECSQKQRDKGYDQSEAYGSLRPSFMDFMEIRAAGNI